jgi:large subunit ribosomal protein L15
MRLQDILSAAGRYKPRKRVGRGEGSGHGKTSGRGSKGKGARAGSKRLFGYEGGQNPLLARIPKRGFNNANFRRLFQVVNVGDLEAFSAGARVDAAALADRKLIRPGGGPVKILGDGSLGKKLTVAAEAFSKSAQAKIAAAGGKVERV